MCFTFYLGLTIIVSMKNTLTVSTKGQITLPKKVRDKLGLTAGSKLQIGKVNNQGVTLRPKLPQEAYYGKFADVFPQDAVAAIRELRDRDVR